MEEAPPRILVIDDDPAILKLTQKILKNAVYDVTGAPGGKEGLELLATETFDCVITDAIMPDVTGYDIVKLIRENPKLSLLPVLMLTRKRNAEDVKRALQVGITDYLVKPIDEDLLLYKLELCLRKGGIQQRQFYEFGVHGPDSQGSLELPVEIVGMSESTVTFKSTSPLTEETPLKLKLKIFDEIGIPVPHLKLISCQSIEPRAGYHFEAKLAFIGMVENDIKKIRGWLVKNEIQRRK